MVQSSALLGSLGLSDRKEFILSYSFGFETPHLQELSHSPSEDQKVGSVDGQKRRERNFADRGGGIGIWIGQEAKRGFSGILNDLVLGLLLIRDCS
jgi:hypothetical protein